MKNGKRLRVSANVAPKKRGPMSRNDRLCSNGARGRPPKHFAHDPNTIEGQRDAARAKGSAELDNVMEFWLLNVRYGLAMVRRTRKPLSEQFASVVLRSAENLANRCGLPIQSELSVRASVPVKLVEARGVVEADGVRVITDVVGPDGEIAN